MDESDHPPQFRPGKNIAMKIPAADFDATVAFYRDILRLHVLEEETSGEQYRSVVFEFGTLRLWVDEAKEFDVAEIWLEIECDDERAAAGYFEKTGVVRKDEVEPLPEEFNGFWIANPAGVIHLLTRK